MLSSRLKHEANAAFSLISEACCRDDHALLYEKGLRTESKQGDQVVCPAAPFHALSDGVLTGMDVWLKGPDQASQKHRRDFSLIDQENGGEIT